MKTRLDVYLMQKFNISRTASQNLIKNGDVFVDDCIANKNNLLVDENAKIEIKDTKLLKYVSRAALKLEGAKQSFGLDFSGKIVLDIGSSTGGFTDFCLQNDALKVYCVDVGNNQLHSKLRENRKVVLMENTDIRNVDVNIFKDINVIVCDVSFISLTKIASTLEKLLNFADSAIVLVKPQFECGKEIAKKHKGVIKDEKIHNNCIKNVKDCFKLHNLSIDNIEKSCLQGTDGNTEFVALVKKIS